MLIRFTDLVNRYGRPKGIIHIGAHLMEERPDYLSHGLSNTIWIEANPKVYSKIESINGLSSEMVFNFAVSDSDNVSIKLNVTNNDQSSSILELEKHKIHHPHIFVSETIEVKTIRMDTLLSRNNISLDNYDFLNIDIQGAELLALKGFGDLLNNIKYIYTEINTNTLYRNCALVGEIDDYLLNFGFSRVETFMTDFEWGDALYLKLK